jgi:hypothetical protein
MGNHELAAFAAALAKIESVFNNGCSIDDSGEDGSAS